MADPSDRIKAIAVPTMSHDDPSVDIVVISLESAVERRKLMEERFSDLPFNWRIFDAHTNLENPSLEYDESMIRRTFGRALSRQELGVWSSHRSVISDFLEKSDSEFLIVFEDDVIFDTSFPILDLLKFCRNRGVHYLRLFGMYAAKSKRVSFFYDRAIIRYKSSPAGAQAYVVSREGARHLAETLRTIDMTIDLAMDQFWKTGLPIFAVFPFPVIEHFSPTSIPMRRKDALSTAERILLTRRRIHRRLCKTYANAALSREDAKIRRAARQFTQVRKSHLAG